MIRALRCRLFPGLLVLVLAYSPCTGFAQGIFRCTAADGQVRFSDKPAPDGNCETVEVAPGPDESRVEEAVGIERGIKESAEALAEDRHKREAEREKLAEERRKQEEEEEKVRQRQEAEAREYNNWRYGGSWPIYRPWPVPPIHKPYPPGPEPEHPIEQPGRPSQLNPPLRSGGIQR
jgi:hypothetical protein